MQIRNSAIVKKHYRLSAQLDHLNTTARELRRERDATQIVAKRVRGKDMKGKAARDDTLTSDSAW